MKKILPLIISIQLIICNSIFSQHNFDEFFQKKKKDVVENEIEKKTKKCIKYNGLFNFYQQKENGNSYLEIDTSHIGKEFIHFCYIENGVSDAYAMKGSYRGSKIIKINKYYDKIEFTIENTKFYFDPESPLERASKTNINTPIVVSEKIIAKNNENTTFLINADNIFLNESLQQIKYTFNRGGGFKLGSLSKKTRYDKIRNYPENTDVVVNYYYENKNPTYRGSEAVTDPRNVSIKVQHSLIQMPDDNYVPRKDDTRVGYFTTKSNNMTSLYRLNYRDFINRWRLEKKNPELDKSEPVKPIIWWIENTTPYELRDVIKKGVEQWNLAFEQAGFINAIQVKIQPDSANWDAGDIRFNVLRWTSSPKPPFSGYGPSFVNPRTGEILGADIMLEWTYITNRIYQDNLFNDNNFKNHDNYDQHQCDAAHYQSFENTLALNYLESLNLSEEIKNDFLKQSLYRLVLHEVGHTLGLNHNFKGSTLLTTEELNNKNIVNEKGICNSVMEYPAINIAEKIENQGLYFDIKPGLYDVWAIQYGYSSYLDSVSEKIGLNKILSRSTEKELAFANDAFDMRRPGKGTDPDAMIYDLSSDQLNFSIQRIKLVERLLNNLKENYNSKNDTYDDLFRSYRTLVYSYFQSLEVVSRQIGGVKVDLSHISQNSEKKPFESVDKETQKQAMDIIAEYAFSDNALIGNDIIPYLQSQRRGFTISEDPQVHERILRYQSRILDQLLHPNVLIRMTNSMLYGNEYDITEYMIDLRKSIFSTDFNNSVSSIRQYLQISYVNRLIKIIDKKSNYDLISRSNAHYNLVWLKNNLNTNLGNLSTKQHRNYLIYIIESATEI
ncbi:MAG: hypothetical protein CMD02_01365 [Flavobacteriales bacterium]|mgnify:CR=1 FL=1|nr:hypothetical protein [Flavobacteriales bacterium]